MEVTCCSFKSKSHNGKKRKENKHKRMNKVKTLKIIRKVNLQSSNYKVMEEELT